MKRSAWIALALVVAGLALVPEIAGRRTESRTREIVDAFNRSGAPWSAVVTSYERGWLRSSSVVRVRLDGAHDVFELHTTWKHAPVAGLSAASGTSEVRLIGAAGSAARPYLGDAPLATASHRVGFRGTLHADIATPRFEVAGAGIAGVRVSGSGSSGTLSLDPAGRFRVVHAYPKLSAGDSGNSLELSDASVTATGRLGDEGFVEPAQASLAVKEIRAAGGGWTLALADVTFAAQATPGAESIDFRFSHALGPGRVEQRGSAHRWNRFALQVTLADIARAAVVGLTRELRRIGELPASDPKRLSLTLEAFSSARDALLARDPTLSLDHLTFEGPDGTLSVSGRARVDRSSIMPATSTPLPLAISVVARVSISRALALAWIASSLKGSAGDARAMADEALGAAAAAGLFREGADPIVVEIVAKEGRVLANGLSLERLAELRAALVRPPPRLRD